MEELLKQDIARAFEQCYNLTVGEDLTIQKTRKEFVGDYTINVFPWVKQIRKSPEEIAQTIGNHLLNNCPYITEFQVIKGFLNLCIHPQTIIEQAFKEPTVLQAKQQKILIEFSSPNTNKPLHLGHIRNNLLGNSISLILSNYHDVVKVNLVNDRGIHICKSMLAWQKWGNGQTPENSNIKGDKLVGDYYVLFDKEYKKQIEQLVADGYSKEEAEKKAPLMLEAQKMLRKWEQGNEKIRNLWKTMNQWVYDGFDTTYQKLGITFDKIYYESETYELGKQYVLKGLSDGVFYQKPDGSVWVDLTGDGLDEKLLLRADGTSVYITQDIGTAVLRYNEFKPDRMIYVVGNEQNYHFQVLKLVLKKLGFAWADSIYHLSYGMVELPEGKMKSREGTVVDADDLIAELEHEARAIALQSGKLKDDDEAAFQKGIEKIAAAALKYFILKVDPEKNMTFNPQESIDFDGNTGTFILYTYARIQSILNKANEQNIAIQKPESTDINDKERELLLLLIDYNNVVAEAASQFNPAKIANYVYSLSKEFNQYYQAYPILKEEHSDVRNFRLFLSLRIAETIQRCLNLLGIDTIDKM